MKRRNGFTMVEVLISMVIISGMFIAALRAAAVAQAGQHRIRLQCQARLLAEDLAAEIDELPFQDPAVTSGLSSIGAGGSEVGSNRELFDDADDYHNWTSSPPQEKDGTVIASARSLTRSVQVEWVELSNPEQVAGYKTGLKRFTVTVSLDEGPLEEIQWLRGWQWPDPVKTKAEGP